VPDSLITNQMKILNDGYRARSFASNSKDVRVEFILVDVHRISNPYWFHNLDWCSGGGLSAFTYLDSIIGNSLLVNSATPWDHNKYLNVISHGAQVGRNATMYPWDAAAFPYFDYIRYDFNNFKSQFNGQRILAHEAGHWLGLHHVNFDICSASCATNGQTTGDLISDTEFATCGSFPTCGAAWDSICGHLSNDKLNVLRGTGDPGCMQRFTSKQVGRMRCGLETYHPSAYLGIIETSIEAPDTVTAFCYRGNALWSFTVSWQTNRATYATNSDTLEVFLPSYSGPCTGATPYTTAVGTPNGVNHSITIQRPCSATGTFKFNIRSRDGILGTRSVCRTFVVPSCPSCSQCDPPCELE